MEIINYTKEEIATYQFVVVSIKMATNLECADEHVISTFAAWFATIFSLTHTNVGSM